MANPFVYDRPLPPADLIDRDLEAKQLLDHLTGGHNARLAAPRRFGKTTLLLRVLHDARELGLHTVYVDFYGAASLGDVVVRMERAYREGLDSGARRAVAGILRVLRPSIRAGVPGAQVELATGDRDADELRRLHELLDLPRRIHERTGTRAVMVFDEFQDVLAAHEGIDGLIRSRIQFHLAEASYVFAGSRPGMLRELFEQSERPFYQQARPFDLGRLADADLAEYIARRFEIGDRDPGTALDPLLDLAQGHPQRAMLLAYHLFEQTVADGVADEDTWLRAQAAAFGELQEAFEATWRGWSETEQRLVAAVTTGGPKLTAESLRSYGLAESSARAARDRLIARGDLERAERGVQVIDPLLAVWVAAGRRAPPS